MPCFYLVVQTSYHIEQCPSLFLATNIAFLDYDKSLYFLNGLHTQIYALYSKKKKKSFNLVISRTWSLPTCLIPPSNCKDHPSILLLPNDLVSVLFNLLSNYSTSIINLGTWSHYKGMVLKVFIPLESHSPSKPYTSPIF